MTAIDEIMGAVEQYGDLCFSAGDYQSEANATKAHEAFAPLRSIITQAIAEARAEGARDAKREPVLLTDEQIRAMSRCPAKCSEVNGLRLMDAPLQFARAIEAAVLAANGMTK